jgi:radical SAM superfamily enzyme YgiQ (UPF0313 family)
MRYEGPIYRPPSEANSLLIQATVGCPHNRCTFCMIYKQRPGFKVRPVADIKADMLSARDVYGKGVRTLFLPDGNTIAMKSDALCEICRFARETFPDLERITVYGSAQYIYKKKQDELKQLNAAGLSRIHVGLESGSDTVLKMIRKGSDSQQQIEAGRRVKTAGIELSMYVILGIGGLAYTEIHSDETARVLNAVDPDFIRLRTFVPKRHTALLEAVQNGSFKMLGPHQVLAEIHRLLSALNVKSYLASDHYTNYINLEGRLPDDTERLLSELESAQSRDESTFRPFFIGEQ